MLIVDSIARTLSLPANSLERSLLKEHANKVASCGLLITAVLGSLLVTVGSLGLWNGDFVSRGWCVLGGAAVAVVGTDIVRMSMSVAQSATDDKVWTPHVITDTLFKNTHILGKLFSRMVEARLNQIVVPVWTRPWVDPVPSFLLHEGPFGSHRDF